MLLHLNCSGDVLEETFDDVDNAPGTHDDVIEKDGNALDEKRHLSLLLLHFEEDRRSLGRLEADPRVRWNACRKDAVVVDYVALEEFGNVGFRNARNLQWVRISDPGQNCAPSADFKHSRFSEN